MGHRSHGAPSGDAPRERPLLELENAFMDAEGVRHDEIYCTRRGKPKAKFGVVASRAS